MNAPKLNLVSPPQFAPNAIRKQLREHSDISFGCTYNPVKGYAIVYFHADGERTCSWHTSEMNLGNSIIDMPDAVRNALKSAIEDTKK